jgi:hypothetical protein
VRHARNLAESHFARYIRAVVEAKLALPCAFIAALATACSYDWTVAAPPTADDGSAPQDAGSTDDSQTDTQGFEAGSCQSRKADLDNARIQARQCVGTCNDKDTDECGCEFAVGSQGSRGSITYESLVAGYLGSLCPTACGTSCPSGTTSTCVNGACQP